MYARFAGRMVSVLFKKKCKNPQMPEKYAVLLAFRQCFCSAFIEKSVSLHFTRIARAPPEPRQRQILTTYLHPGGAPFTTFPVK